jgi:hypothetical protein
VPEFAPEALLANQPPLAPEIQPEAPVESQFRPVEGADEMLDMPLGTLIFRAGLIAPQQLEDALAEGLRSGKRLGEVLLARGWLSEEDLSRLLAGQKGLPYADLEKIAIDRELAQAMSYDDARNEMALPVVAEFGVPVIAMADPDEAAMDRLRAQLGSEVRFVVGAPSVLTRLIDEVLGGAPAPGLLVAPTADVQSEPVEPSAAESYAPDEPPPAEPVQPETVAEPEPVALNSSDQETPAPDPDFAAQEIRPIIAEGEVDYPTFTEYQPIPEAEIITGSDEQLPAEVQMGEYGYYDDPSLLEGNAWQAGEAGPPAAEPAGEINDLTSDQYNAEQPPAEAEAPVEEPQPAEEVAQPFAEAEAPVEELQPVEEIDAAIEEPQPAEEVAQPVVEAEAPVEQDWEEQAQEVEVEQPMFAPAPEQPEEVAGEPSSEEGLTVTTPAWMRGEVNVITADVADFIDSGAPTTPEYSTPPPVENGDVAEVEPEPVVSEDAAVEVEPILEQTAEAEAIEPPAQPDDLTPIEPAATGLGAEAPSWASERVNAAEPNVDESVGDVSPEPPATPAGESSSESSRGVFELVLRLADGDLIPIGSFDTVEDAQGKAAEVVKQFAEIKEGGWPFIGGRFLRPETIVSIDVEQHGSGWGGSNARGRMFSGNEGE